MSSSANRNTVVQIVSALIVKDNKYLIAQRPPNAVQPLLWEFPGGRVRSEESGEAALRRKMNELMGIDIEVGAEILQVRHSYGDYDVDFRVYECKLMSDEIKNIKVHAHRWVSEEELSNYRFPEADRRTLEQLMMTPCW